MENSHNAEVAGHDIKGSYINRIYMKSSGLYLWLITGILGYAPKIPYIGRIITLLGLWYGRTTWWKILIKIRKLFIVMNAIIGVYVVFKTVGFSTDNLIAGFVGLGHTYFEILYNFTKRLFTWFFDLLDMKIVPNIPGDGTKPNLPKNYGIHYPRGLDYSWNQKLPKLDNIPNDWFKPGINFNIGSFETTPWYKDWSTVYWIAGVLGSVGLAYISYKLYSDPAIVKNFIREIFFDTAPEDGKGGKGVQPGPDIAKTSPTATSSNLSQGNSLAMKIYKTHYMPDNKVYQLHGLVEKNIRLSYTGGAVDVYIPHNKIDNEFIELFYYDVNALYPTVMIQQQMPVGKPIAFEGDIRKVNQNAYGFFYCNIATPEYLEHPIIQRRVRTKSGIRTIAGLGNWNGWISSTEMDNAINFGYKFEIIKGYKFENDNIFENYVTELYNLRLQYEKGTPMNMIAKLLMNSLYGKFGMTDERTRLEILDNTTEEDKSHVSEFLDMYGTDIIESVELDNYIIIIRNYTELFYNDKYEFFHGSDTNIAIASTITAGARVHMSKFKNNPLFKLYYSDTDSAVTDRPLPDYMVGTELGQVKLEHVIKKAVFLAPKVYGFVTTDGSEIIKVKGINQDLVSDIHINDLENLLLKDSSKEFTQEKWFKKVIEGDITFLFITR